MKGQPTIEQVNEAKQGNVWDFGNDILYRLCKDNFSHNTDDKILTKVLFIGRIYAAAIERRKNKSTDIINDNFYIDVVAPKFRQSKLDNYLVKLKDIETLKVDNIELILQTHYYLTNTIKEITALEKRSFCSKYLHFHLPELFYIYDSRAVSALRQFTGDVSDDLKQLLKSNSIDIEYAKFFCKCYDLKRQIENLYKIILTSRQLDNLLIEVANRLNSEKKKNVNE